MKYLRSLRPVDVLIVAFLALLSIIIFCFLSRIDVWMPLTLANLVACIAIVLLAYRASMSAGGIVKALHDWYPVPTIFLVFKEVHVIIQTTARSDWDPALIAIDHAIFGVHPTVWFSQFATPVVTEILQIAYASYYFIMLTVTVELFVRNDRRNFSFVLFMFAFGFFLSYLGYIAFPAIGPRFTLHNFDALNVELPGLFATNAIREILNAGESIPAGAMNALALAQRDAFPSGHTEMTLLSLYLAHKFRLRSRHVLFLFGTLLIISTVYMRYHYVVDLVGGAVAMLITVLAAPRVFEGWDHFTTAVRPKTFPFVP